MESNQREEQPLQEEKSNQQEEKDVDNVKGCLSCLGCLVPIVIIIVVVVHLCQFWWSSFHKEKAHSNQIQHTQTVHKAHAKTAKKEEKKAETQPAPAPNPTPAPALTDETVEAPSNPPPLPSFGEKVQVGHLFYTIHSMRTTKTVGEKLGLTETAKGIYFIVDFTLESDAVPSDLSGNNLFAIKMGNQEFPVDADATSSINSVDSLDDHTYNYIGDALLSINSYKRGEIAFDLPPNSTNLLLKVRGSISDWEDDYNKTALIRLYVNK